MRLAPLALLILAALPARADTPPGDRLPALDQVILPGLDAFRHEAQALADAARADCRRPSVLPAYDAAREAWGRIGDLRLGPTEQAALTIAFWPDDRASGLRALRGQPTEVSALPASARGFSGLDLMLGEDSLAYEATDPGCALVTALAEDLSTQATALVRAWQDHAALLRAPGQGGDLTYLDRAEVQRALYTQALAALDLTLGQRIGRPLGDAAEPRLARAEAWRTGRSLPNARGAAHASHALAAALAGAPTPRMDLALQAVDAAADAIDDPGFQDIADPQARLKLEILGQHIADLRMAMETEVGAALALSPGFNALDGD